MNSVNFLLIGVSCCSLFSHNARCTCIVYNINKHLIAAAAVHYIHYCLLCVVFSLFSFCKLEFKIFFNLVFLVSRPVSFNFALLSSRHSNLNEKWMQKSISLRTGMRYIFKLKFLSPFPRLALRVKTSNYWYAKFMSVLFTWLSLFCCMIGISSMVISVAHLSTDQSRD